MTKHVDKLAERQINMQLLIAQAKSYSIANNWLVHIAESSISFTSPKRNKVVKVNSNFRFTIDIIKSPIDVKSTAFNCKTLGEAWQMTRQALDAFQKEIT